MISGTSIDIKIIGTGCAECDQLFKNAKDAVRDLSIDAEVSKVEDLIEIVKLGVMRVPSMMVNGKVVVSGQVVSAKKIMQLLKS